jgi:hypothetical protein
VAPARRYGDIRLLFDHNNEINRVCSSRGLGELDYPIHNFTATVASYDRVCYKCRKVNSSTFFSGQKVGIKEVYDKTWPVNFMQYDLGFFDLETCGLECIENSIAQFPHSIECSCLRTISMAIVCRTFQRHQALSCVRYRTQ